MSDMLAGHELSTSWSRSGVVSKTSVHGLLRQVEWDNDGDETTRGENKDFEGLMTISSASWHWPPGHPCNGHGPEPAPAGRLSCRIV